MKRLYLCAFFVLAALLLLGGVAESQDTIPRLTKEELKPLLGNPDVAVIDVRAKGDWEKETSMIKGAVREDPMNVASWIDKYPKGTTLVFYCS